eukprot:scaffold141739_cov21-Tisochrysis_lutea.AAC.1
MPGKEHSSSVIGWVLAYASVYALSKPVSRMLHASTSRRPDWKKKVLEGLVHTAHRLVQETAYLGSLIVHSTLAGQITLVSHKQLVYILVCVSVDLVQPCLHVVEALHLYGIEPSPTHNDTMSATIVAAGNSAEALLSSCIPLRKGQMDSLRNSMIDQHDMNMFQPCLLIPATSMCANAQFIHSCLYFAEINALRLPFNIHTSMLLEEGSAATQSISNQLYDLPIKVHGADFLRSEKCQELLEVSPGAQAHMQLLLCGNRTHKVHSNRADVALR